MLSLEQRLIADSFRYPGGMLNAAWIAGYLRNRDNKQGFHIMASNNEDTMIPIRLKKGESVPRMYHERNAVRVIAHVTGRADEDGRRYPELTAIGFDFATVLDLPLEAAFDAAFGAKKEGEEGFKPFRGKNSKLSMSANVVRLAGFVQAVSLKKGTGDTPSCCTLLLRQREDESSAIPICYEGRLAEAVANRISRGTPMKIVASFQIASEKDADGNKIYVPRLLATLAPGAVSREDIRGVPPEWALQMIDELRASRAAKEPVATKQGSGEVVIDRAEPERSANEDKNALLAKI